MITKFGPNCAQDCIKFQDCQIRLENARGLEIQADDQGHLNREGIFRCAAYVVGKKCLGRVEQLPEVSDETIMSHIETILSPIAIDALAAETEKGHYPDL